ncbi:MAG: pimeloyl-ACP methyl ester esterase BioH [Xanthomonadaceae bacterium]|nr:pimeloyl-ACP methyl ester esterase BioH [Xanthomonadaceae bacterium]
MNLHTQTSGTGPDLFLIHGWGLNGTIWSGLRAALEADYRVTAVDLPGHGRSPGGTFDLDSASIALREAAPPQAHWIAWSLGGLLALHAARPAPERITGLTLVASSPRFVQAPDWPHAVPAAVLAQFLDELQQDYRATLNRFLALQVRGSAEAGGTLRALRGQLFAHGEPDPTALAAGLAILRDADLRPGLDGITLPLQFIMGERDTLIPAAAARACVARAPAAQLEVIAGAGHAPFLSHPREFLAALRPFLPATQPREVRHHGG